MSGLSLPASLLALGYSISLAKALQKDGFFDPSDEEILADLIIRDRTGSSRKMAALGDVLPVTLRAIAGRSIQYWRRCAADQSLDHCERHGATAEANAIVATCRRLGLLDVPDVL